MEQTLRQHLPEKWAIAWLPGQTFKITSFQHFLGGLEDTELKTGNFQSLTTKPSYSSFFSVLYPDLKDVFFLEKFTEPLLRSSRSQRPFSRSPGPNFGFHLFLIGFHLEFSLFWISRSFDLNDLGDLRRGSGNFFKNYIFEISAFQGKRWGMSRLSRRNFP